MLPSTHPPTSTTAPGRPAAAPGGGRAADVVRGALAPIPTDLPENTA
jgi:hypothetical protein